MSLFELRTAYQNGRITKQQYIDEMHGVHARLFEYAEFLRNTDIARIEITDEQVVMQERESTIRIVCDKADKRIAPIEILNFGNYEKADMNMVLQLLQDGQTVFDVGANVGWYSITFAKRFPNMQVFAFEPISATFGYLQRNIALNQLANIRVNNFGFSDHNGELVFHFHPAGSGSASAVDLMGTGTAQRIHCTVRKLDDFVVQAGVTRIDFMKCDVEGAELFVLVGGIESIKRFKPMIFIEMLRKWAAKFNYHPNQIIELMTGIGYRCFVRKDNALTEFRHMDEQTVETNFFFLHTHAHAAKVKAFAKSPI